MTDKCTFYVSDVLADNIAQYEESFNPASLFQGPEDTPLKRKEEYREQFEADPDMPSILARLQIEKNQIQNELLDIGYEDGIEWCKSAHLKMIIELQGHASPLGILRNEGGSTRRSKGLSTVHRCIETTSDGNPVWSSLLNQVLDRGLFSYSHLNEEFNNVNVCNWLSGWFEAFNVFWDAIKDDLDLSPKG